MTARIVLAGIIGGLLMFVMGAVNHAALDLGGRSVHNLPDEAALKSVISSQQLAHGIYGFPAMPDSANRNDKTIADVNERYKTGPNGMLIIGRTGEDMMSAHQLGGELGTNIVFCLMAAWIISRFDPRNGFLTRWLAVVILGAMAWLSISASYAIWYRFHSSFIHDELYGSLIEAAVAGLAIAAIVKPKPFAAPATAATV